MTLLELQKRINDMVAENKERGHDDVNFTPVVFRLYRQGKVKRLRPRWFRVNGMSSGRITIGTDAFVEISGREDAEVGKVVKP